MSWADTLPCTGRWGLVSMRRWCDTRRSTDEKTPRPYPPRVLLRPFQVALEFVTILSAHTALTVHSSAISFGNMASPLPNSHIFTDRTAGILSVALTHDQNRLLLAPWARASFRSRLCRNAGRYHHQYSSKTYVRSSSSTPESTATSTRFSTARKSLEVLKPG